MFGWLYNLFGNKQSANQETDNERRKRLHQALKEQHKKYEQSEMCKHIKTQSKSKPNLTSDNTTQSTQKSRDSFSDMSPFINTPSSDGSSSYSCHDSYSDSGCDSGGGGGGD